MPLPPVASIAGVGTDIIRVVRIQAAFERRGLGFARRILGEQELQVFQRRYQRDVRRGIRYLATRFAAKEAFSKAIGLGMHSPMTWRSMQALNVRGGRPVIELGDTLAQWYTSRFGPAHISLTDESDLAMAFVVIEHLSSFSANPSP